MRYALQKEKLGLGGKMFDLFKKNDPVCGMNKEKEKGSEKYGHWFCSKNCLDAYEKKIKRKGGCCH